MKKILILDPKGNFVIILWFALTCGGILVNTLFRLSYRISAKLKLRTLSQTYFGRLPYKMLLSSLLFWANSNKFLYWLTDGESMLSERKSLICYAIYVRNVASVSTLTVLVNEENGNSACCFENARNVENIGHQTSILSFRKHEKLVYPMSFNIENIVHDRP